VLVATSIAFPSRPIVVVARLLASLTTALVVGWLWGRFGRSPAAKADHHHDHDDEPRWFRFQSTAAHDIVQGLGMLVVGAAAAATMKVVVPRSWLTTFSGNVWLGIVMLAGFAVLLAVCSVADAFVASSLIQFSLTARLVFMTVGPAIDLKLLAMQVGTFGPRFALRLAPLTLLVATASAAMFGWLLL
jgi:uncharacterized membrane protein YraQ (UPF0718 family)